MVDLSFFLNACCVLVFYVFLCFSVCLFSSGPFFVMVPLNLTCIRCLQHSFFKHHFNLYSFTIILQRPRITVHPANTAVVTRDIVTPSNKIPLHQLNFKYFQVNAAQDCTALETGRHVLVHLRCATNYTPTSLLHHMSLWPWAVPLCWWREMSKPSQAVWSRSRLSTGRRWRN